MVNLSGTNTIRLTIDSPQNRATRNGLAMNYVVFVPTVPQLYSAEAVNGTYAPESSVLLDAGNKKFTVPQSGATRFYRTSWNTQLRINGISVTAGNVVLTYQ